MTTCVFAMGHDLVLTPSQEARRERRRKKRAENQQEDVISVQSDDTEYLRELAKLKVKKRRESGSVKTEAESTP